MARRPALAAVHDHKRLGGYQGNRGSDQRDLLVGEGADGSAQQSDHADGYSFTQQRHAKSGTKASFFLNLSQLIFGVRQHIGQMNDFAFQQRPPNDAASSRRVRNASEVLFEPGRAAGYPLNALRQTANVAPGTKLNLSRFTLPPRPISCRERSIWHEHARPQLQACQQ
jgi:hypothetical protein